MAAVALVLQAARGGGRVRGERREHARQLRAHAVLQTREPLRVDRLGVLVECVHERAERQVLLELGGRAAEDELALRVCT